MMQMWNLLCSNYIKLSICGGLLEDMWHEDGWFDQSCRAGTSKRCMNLMPFFASNMKLKLGKVDEFKPSGLWTCLFVFLRLENDLLFSGLFLFS